MKVIIIILASLVLCSCSFERDIQLKPILVTVSQVDTVMRGEDYKLMVTYIGEDKVRYTAFYKIPFYEKVGYSKIIYIK